MTSHKTSLSLFWGIQKMKLKEVSPRLPGTGCGTTLFVMVRCHKNRLGILVDVDVVGRKVIIATLLSKVIGNSENFYILPLVSKDNV